jgi:hypothetical protein
MRLEKEGIAMLWRDGIDVNIQNCSRNHIDMEVKGEDNKVWRFTWIYGDPRAEH